MKIENIIGIDPGLNGSWFILDISGKVIDYQMFPLIEKEVRNYRKPKGLKPKKATRIERTYDLNKLSSAFTFLADGKTVAYLEKVNSRPGEGASFAFKFGRCYGEIRAVLACCGIPFTEVAPATWCAYMHKGIPGSNAKQRSKSAFGKIFHDEFRGHKKIHDGIIDAGCIAEFGRQRINLEIKDW